MTLVATDGRTSYEPHRRRLLRMEAVERLRLGSLAAARRALARATALTPEQQANIREGKRKSLAGETERRIDEAFVELMRREIRDLEHELALADAGVRGVDPGAVAKAKASLDALEQLIREAEQPDAGGRKPCS